MPPTETLIAFIIATGVFAYMPGPSTLYAAAQTIARGRGAGWFAALGIHVGGYAHVIAAALGLAILFETIPAFYLTVKIGGAVYLVWLGVKMFASKAPGGDASVPMETKNPKRAFRDSMAVEVLNPKTAIFYLAFLPQFTDPNASLAIWAQLLILGTIVNVVFSSADVLCVVLADRIMSMFRKSGATNRIAQRIGGSVLVGLGVKVAFDR